MIIKIYDYFCRHKRLLWSSLVGLTIMFVTLVLNLNYNEDISDFLPLGTSDREALSVYQNISGANRLYILFTNPDDPDQTVEAIECFTDYVNEHDTLEWCNELTTQFDMSQIQEVTSFVYDNIPYFLNADDYARMDSLLHNPDYITEQLNKDKEMLMLPSSGLVSSNIIRDPLALFTPVLSKLQDSNQQLSFEMYDGYIFTPDMSRAVAMMSSPFGNSETEQNSKLMTLLNNAIEEMGTQYPAVKAHVVGGPEIAVGNASRIKSDSILSIILSSILIILLLVYAFNSIRNILLILLSISWGWLFALGGMALLSNHVSIIVIGISSVILGIAVNYPLHLIAHTSHEPRIRVAVREIMMPLVVGNITTVGAFLALVPLQSTALRDLGLFASLLLVGTIIFVLMYLPHLVKIKPTVAHKTKLLNSIANFSPERYKVLVALVAIITIVLAFFSLQTEFDSNIANINYMTDQQREDMQYFQSLMSKDSLRSTQSIYVLSKGSNYDKALTDNAKQEPTISQLQSEGMIHQHRGVSRFIVSKAEQQQRLARWKNFVEQHKSELTDKLMVCSAEAGFAPEAFTQFTQQIADNDALQPQEMDYFSPLTQLILSQNITQIAETQTSYIVDILDVENDKMDAVKSRFDNCFDVVSMNGALSNNLSDNFNYIGWTCSLIVFIFLWFSFGRIELAIISFLPMAISWVWILGIMALLGIKFNIVNVILATFIFGQGDDYTIFMTEGCQHEYTYHRPILASYKSSIIQSALIMFVGIGTLIVAKHPAMHSLAEVTIIGMFSVVLMAYMIPPLLFRWLTTSNGQVRQHPITLRTMLLGQPKQAEQQVYGRYIYKGMEISKTVKRNLSDCASTFSQMLSDSEQTVHIADHGYGEQAIYLAFTHPEWHVVAKMDDQNRLDVALATAKDFVNNIEFTI